MAKLMKTNLYRILHSKITIILLVASCLFAFDSADLRTESRLYHSFETDQYAFERTQNVFDLWDCETKEEIWERFYNELNYPDMMSNIMDSRLVGPIFLCALVFGQDLHKRRLQNELLRYSRGKILASRMILYYILCIAVHAGLLIYGLMSDKYVNLEMYSTDLLVKNAALSILIGLSRSASVFLIFCLCRNAIIGGVASVAAFLVIGKSSRILNYSPIMEVKEGFFTTAGSSELSKWAIVSVAYVVVFTVLAFVVFRRKEFR